MVEFVCGLTAVSLVWAIGTIFAIITVPSGVDTRTISACKLLRRASHY